MVETMRTLLLHYTTLLNRRFSEEQGLQVPESFYFTYAS